MEGIIRERKSRKQQVTDPFPTRRESTGRASAVVAGTRWMTVGEMATQILRMVTYVWLARILEPRHFGVLAMALVITNFVDVIKDLGTRSAVIQKKDVSQGFASSIFVVNVIVAAFVIGVIVAIAPLVGNLFGTPDVIPVLRVMSLAIGIAALGLVQQGLLYRAMRFRALALAQITGAVIQGIVALSMGALGFGVWALVAGIIASALSTTSIIWTASRWRPHLHIRWNDIREVASFSLNLSGARVLTFLVNDADKFIIGRALGAAALGLYSLGWRIVSQILTATGNVLQQILFPALSAIQDDNARIRRDFLRMMSAVALVFFPLTIGLAVVAGPFVRAVLGVDWVPAIPLITILALIAPIQVLIWGAGILFQVKGRTDWMLRWRIVSGLTIVGAYILGLRWGLIGVTASFAFAVVVLSYPAMAIPFRLIDLDLPRFLQEMVPYAVASGVMAVLVAIAQRLVDSLGGGDMAMFISSVAVGVAVYGSFVWWYRPDSWHDALVLLGARN